MDIVCPSVRLPPDGSYFQDLAETVSETPEEPLYWTFLRTTCRGAPEAWKLPWG